MLLDTDRCTVSNNPVRRHQKQYFEWSLPLKEHNFIQTDWEFSFPMQSKNGIKLIKINISKHYKCHYKCQFLISFSFFIRTYPTFFNDSASLFQQKY